MCMCGCWSRLIIQCYIYIFYKDFLSDYCRYIYLSHGAVLCMHVCNYIKNLLMFSKP